MISKFEVRTNADAVLRGLAEFRVDVRTKALVRALNRLAEQVRTQASRQIRVAGYQLKAATVRKQLTLKQASASNIVATIIASGRPIPLIDYSARQTSVGVSVNVLNGRKVIKDAFIATMPTGHRGVFVRVGPGHKRVVKNGVAKWYGLPIKELFGPSVPDAMANDAVQRALGQFVQEKFPQIFERELRYYGSRV